jgi:hypothetical protein
LEEGRFNPENAGATDKNIEPPKGFYGCPDQGMDRGFVGNIGGDVAGALAQCFDFFDHGMALVEQVGNDNVAAFFGQAQRARASETACAAGDQGDAACFGCGKT